MPIKQVFFSTTASSSKQSKSKLLIQTRQTEMQKLLLVLSVLGDCVDLAQDVVKFLLIEKLHELVIGPRVGAVNEQLASLNQCPVHLV